MDEKIKNIGDVILSCKKEIVIDYIGLWQIHAYAEILSDASGDDAIRAKTIEIVLALLGEGFVVGGLGESCFLPWDNQTADYVSSRIAGEWSALGHQLWPGDICWIDKVT